MNLLKKLQYTVKRVAVGLMSIMLLSGASQQTEGSITTREKALEVIEKYIEATGGRKAWSKLETMEFWHISTQYPVTETEYLIPAKPEPDSVTTESVTYYDKTQGIHKWIDLTDGGEMCHNGHSFYYTNSKGITREIAEDADFYKEGNFKMDLPDLLMNIREGDLVEYVGIDSLDSVLCDVIRLKRRMMFKPTLLYIDRDNSLLMATKSDPEDAFVDRISYKLKYTKVNDVLMSLENLTYKSGKLWMKGRSRVRFNIDISDKIDCN